MKYYEGTMTNNVEPYQDPKVTVRVVDKKNRHYRPLRHVAYHSPSGFSWGFHGSGPADLALSILVHHFGERPPRKGWQSPKFSEWTEKSEAWRYHQYFKVDFVAKFQNPWMVTSEEIDNWHLHQSRTINVGNPSSNLVPTLF